MGEDLISRRAALEWLKTEWDGMVTSVFDGIEQLPSTDRTGRWEIYVISPFDGEGCRCSECGSEGAPYWDYCPNCGASMSGGDNDG